MNYIAENCFKEQKTFSNNENIFLFFDEIADITRKYILNIMEGGSV